MAIPFLGRLHPTEYFALVGSFLLVGLEAFIRVATLALPPFLVSLFYRASRRIFNRFSTPAQKRAENRRASISTSVRDASDFVELCRIWGYEAEEHIVQTKDGFLLGVHRLQWRKGEEGQKVNAGPTSLRKRVAYLHHGLLMNSEVWVSLTDERRCLAFELVERGFDVWFGNNRGNKYSKKSIHCSPTSTTFWDFSMDEFAFHDIPDSIAYILDATQQESLSYIGFSQGTAQAFATLAIHPKLNDQVNVFIALAPAMSPAGLSNGVVDSLVKASPQVLYLMFGRRSILSSATMWETLLYPPIFSRVIDMGLSFLFNWQTKNISASQKLAAYPHLYSFTSTKSVVHWFQIIRNKCFQMYDDDVHQPMSVSKTNKYSKVAKYPTRNIKTPIVLVYGGSDSLVDIKAMLKELPSKTIATEIPHYEHLDFLWARDVDTQVFQHVFDALNSFTDAAHSKEEYDKYYTVRQESLIGSGFPYQSSPRGSESETSTVVASTVDGGITSQPIPHRAREDFVKPKEHTEPPQAKDETEEPTEVSEPKVENKESTEVPEVKDEDATPPALAETGQTIQSAENDKAPSEVETAPVEKPRKKKLKTKVSRVRRGSVGSNSSLGSKSREQVAGESSKAGDTGGEEGGVVKSSGSAVAQMEESREGAPLRPRKKKKKIVKKTSDEDKTKESGSGQVLNL